MGCSQILAALFAQGRPETHVVVSLFHLNANSLLGKVKSVDESYFTRMTTVRLFAKHAQETEVCN